MKKVIDDIGNAVKPIIPKTKEALSSGLETVMDTIDNLTKGAEKPLKEVGDFISDSATQIEDLIKDRIPKYLNEVMADIGELPEQIMQFLGISSPKEPTTTEPTPEPIAQPVERELPAKVPSSIWDKNYNDFISMDTTVIEGTGTLDVEKEPTPEKQIKTPEPEPKPKEEPKNEQTPKAETAKKEVVKESPKEETAPVVPEVAPQEAPPIVADASYLPDFSKARSSGKKEEVVGQGTVLQDLGEDPHTDTFIGDGTVVARGQTVEEPEQSKFERLSKAKLVRTPVEKVKHNQIAEYFKMTYKPKVKGKATRSEVRTLIKKAAKVVDVDENLLLGVAWKESSLGQMKKAKTSSAKGIYQFIDRTWKGELKQNGKKFGYTGKVDPMDDAANTMMAAAAFRRYKDKLGDLYEAPNDLYIMHFMGEPRGKRFISLVRSEPDTKAATKYPKEAKANAKVFYKEVIQPKKDKEGEPVLDKKGKPVMEKVKVSKTIKEVYDFHKKGLDAFIAKETTNGTSK